MTSVFTDTTTPTPEVTMSTTTARNIQVLSAMDFGPNGAVVPDLDALVSAMGDAVLRVVTHEVPHWKDADRKVVEHLVVFDAGILRNTEAHGMGYRRGFVVSVRQPADVQEALDADTARQRRAALVELNAADARRGLRSALAAAAHDKSIVYITISLPQPWGAARCYADGRVTDCRGEVDAELTALVAS